MNPSTAPQPIRIAKGSHTSRDDGMRLEIQRLSQELAQLRKEVD